MGDPHAEAYFDLGTPRQYTARGGWNIVCDCGEVIGESGDEDVNERHERHRKEAQGQRVEEQRP